MWGLLHIAIKKGEIKANYREIKANDFDSLIRMNVT